MTSITAGKTGIKIWAVVFWLIVWEIMARYIGQEILLVSPVTVLLTFFKLSLTPAFWNSILFSFSRIILGFTLALMAGIILAAISSACVYIRELLKPLMAVIKATPVASFIILILIWISSRNLSIIISFLMVLPVIYSNILQGIEGTDSQLLEMACIFRISRFRRIRYIYFYQLLPYFKTACSLSLGLCWKAGVAAEVIGIPDGSIGEKLYESKIYLQTAELFAWTLTIILLSVGFEKIFLILTDKFTLMKEQG